MDFTALKALIETHPEYPAVDDAALTAWCNDLAVQQTRDRINSDDLYELIDGAEWNALTQEQQAEVWNVLLLFSSTGVPTSPSARARARILAIFGAQSATIQAVVAAITYQVSRAAAASVGADSVREGDVAYARTI